MQERIKNYLNEPFPLFLSYRQGKIYFILLILILALSLNILQPLGLINWHEFHKGLVLSGYSLTYVGTYAVLYFVYSRLRPAYFRRESWTKGKELHILSIYIPLTAVSSWVFAALQTKEVQLGLNSFLSLQVYNSIAGVFTIPGFGYFVSTKIKPVQQIPEETPLANTELQQEKQEKQETLITPTATTGENNMIIIKNIHLDAINILFAESRRNDLHIYHVYNGKVQRLEKILTLAEFEELVSGYPFMKRCHKSYVVNINYIASWEGTLAKMTLHLKNCTHTVSVSENFSPEFKELMELRSVPKLK